MGLSHSVLDDIETAVVEREEAAHTLLAFQEEWITHAPQQLVAPSSPPAAPDSEYWEVANTPSPVARSVELNPATPHNVTIPESPLFNQEGVLLNPDRLAQARRRSKRRRPYQGG